VKLKKCPLNSQACGKSAFLKRPKYRGLISRKSVRVSGSCSPGRSTIGTGNPRPPCPIDTRRDAWGHRDLLHADLCSQSLATLSKTALHIVSSEVFTAVLMKNIFRLLGYRNPVRTSQETHYVSSTELSRLLLSKICGFHGGDYEKYCLLGYRNPVHTSQETHYVSATESSRLMLCKIWGFHEGDYEECRLLWYTNPVRTSQETHYVSSTEPSRLLLCKIWGFHGDDYEEYCLLGYRNPVHTSQETHYVSATESSRLMLCKIWVFKKVTMKNAFFWDTETQFLSHRRHFCCRAQSLNAM
jgi:hypothetical protein